MSESWYKKYKVDIPEKEQNGFKIERFTVSNEQANMHSLQTLFSGHGYQVVHPGTYTKLTYDNKRFIMSDTPAEIRDHHSFIYESHGKVLIAGLGIGMVLNAVASKEKVEKVTVVEVSQDIIDLVWSHYKKKFGDKIELIQDDILEWKPPKGYNLWDCAWFDIWDNICQDNWEEYKLLMRRYARKVTDFKGCWARDEIMRMNEEDRRNDWMW